MLEGLEPALRIEAHADRVEADLWRPRPIEPPLSEPLARHRSHLPLLSHPDRSEWPEHVPRGEPDHPGLHLTEDEKASVPRDDVELAVAGPEVALDDLEPPRLEVPRGELLTPGPEPSPRIGHRAVRSQPPRSRRTRWPSASRWPSAA